MCNCKNITPQSQECYDQMILVEIPTHMDSYRQSRLTNGLSGTISIDPCIIDEIRELWAKGIITMGSCCGHNALSSFVNVTEHQSQAMLDMGYEMNHWDKTRTDTFKLKSA